jgi:predicted negative regulator of RcsB-dependent stress response
MKVFSWRDKGVAGLARKKIKTNSKDVRKAEDIIKVPEEAMSWLQARQQWLLGGGIALLVVVVMVWAFTSYGQVRERRAQLQYGQTLSKLAGRQNLEAQAWAPLIAELKSLCENYRGTKAASSAQLDLAQAYCEAGQYDQAVLWDQKNLQDLKANPPAQVLARFRLVLSYRALNKLDEALTQCEVLQNMSAPGLSREVQWQMGLLYAAKKDASKAAEHFQKALELDGTYPPEGMIQEGLAQVRLAGSSHEPKATQGSSP